MFLNLPSSYSFSGDIGVFLHSLGIVSDTAISVVCIYNTSCRKVIMEFANFLRYGMFFNIYEGERV